LAIVVVATVTALAGGSVAYADREYAVTTASAQQQTAQINHAFADSPAVRVCVYGSFPCVGVGGVPVTFAAPGSGASGTFAGSQTSTTTVTSAANGLATAPVFTANDVAGSYSMRIAALEQDCFDDPSGPHDPPWCAGTT